jgi:hypothetical protein
VSARPSASSRVGNPDAVPTRGDLVELRYERHTGSTRRAGVLRPKGLGVTGLLLELSLLPSLPPPAKPQGRPRGGNEAFC